MKLSSKSFKSLYMRMEGICKISSRW